PAAAPLPTIEVGNVALGTQSALIAAGSGRLADGDLAPDFSYTMADGSSHTLSELRGTRVVLNFWATWCMPCREEMPTLQQLADEHSADLVVLAVNRNEAPAAIAKFGNEVGVTFPLIANITGDIADRYGATSLPLSYFINSEGTISSHQLGALTPAILARHMEGLR
ncbi:MAG: TlpA family protein disulfide reductase, partial [Oscillochloris sp.]|nr:TlpA family protein disulfide reductase [Oscillochloris sp.]